MAAGSVSQASNALDLQARLRAYLEKMLGGVEGYKALVVDGETLRTVSTVYSQTDLSGFDVFCTELIEKGVDAGAESKHLELEAVCFLRPTRANISLMSRQLREPRFKAYRVYFTNILPSGFLTDLAQADRFGMIEEIHEFYGDFVALDPDHFVIPATRSECMLAAMGAQLDRDIVNAQHAVVDRVVEGLVAVMAALKRRPAIRHRTGSEACKRIATYVHDLAYEQERELFDFGMRGNAASPLLLVLDRRDDPVTPLLSQWTYQAMVHELLGIDDNTCKLPYKPQVPKEMQHVVLNAYQDDFFRKHMHANFGELGAAVKKAVEDFSRVDGENRNINSIEDMKNFVVNYSDFSSHKRVVSKHVNLMSELSTIVTSKDLFNVSELEQELSCSTSGNAQGDLDSLITMWRSSSGALNDTDKLRLAMLWALRYEADPRIHEMLDHLSNVVHDGPKQATTVRELLRWAGATNRRGDLFGNKSVAKRFSKIAGGLKGVENVYTQHRPLLEDILRAVAENRLSTSDYPFAGSAGEIDEWTQRHKSTPPREVVVFIVGGTTYEEAKVVAAINADKSRNMTVVLGGPERVLKSKNFVRDFKASRG